MICSTLPAGGGGVLRALYELGVAFSVSPRGAAVSGPHRGRACCYQGSTPRQVCALRGKCWDDEGCAKKLPISTFFPLHDIASLSSFESRPGMIVLLYGSGWVKRLFFRLSLEVHDLTADDNTSDCVDIMSNGRNLS